MASRKEILELLANGKITADIFIYNDDVRPSGGDKEESWEACQRISSLSNHLGIQGAARKRRAPVQEGGAWAGSLVYTTGGQIMVLVS